MLTAGRAGTMARVNGSRGNLWRRGRPGGNGCVEQWP